MILEKIGSLMLLNKDLIMIVRLEFFLWINKVRYLIFIINKCIFF